jgi:hypothetical protein
VLGMRKPQIAARVAAGICLLMMACSILARAGEGSFGRLSARAVTALSWFTAVYVLIAVILNLITRSPGERNLWAPVSIVLLLLVANVMASTRRLPSPSAALGPSGRQ